MNPCLDLYSPHPLEETNRRFNLTTRFPDRFQQFDPAIKQMFGNIFAHESKRVATMELVVNSKGYATVLREQVSEMKDSLVKSVNTAASTVIKSNQVTYPTLCILAPAVQGEVAWWDIQTQAKRAIFEQMHLHFLCEFQHSGKPCFHRTEN
jgi:hypothetical protein